MDRFFTLFEKLLLGLVLYFEIKRTAKREKELAVSNEKSLTVSASVKKQKLRIERAIDKDLKDLLKKIGERND